MKQTWGLAADFYELTMIQGYFLEQNNPQVVFDMFYRSQPFQSGYALFAGMGTLTEHLSSFRFSEEDISYLKSLGLFRDEFLQFLKSFRFTGDIFAVREGTPVFPGEPLIRVHGSLIEAQLIESFLLNIINFQTLIATKTSRVYCASRRGSILEFGLRRAQGLNGALSASRASYIGGAAGTSNTMAGKVYGIPVMGTMAHSWVMSFSSELDSFKAFARMYPDTCILLIDTYDTLHSGLPNAIEVGLALKNAGKRIGVRIDSGDLSYLSKRVRKALDEAGLEDALITVSNDLNEEIIHQLVSDDAPVNSWGVGTALVTGGNQAAMNGVYKLCARYTNGSYMPTMKISNNLEKSTNPGIKQVYRFYRGNEALADLTVLDHEQMDPGSVFRFNHPTVDQDFFHLRPGNFTHMKALLEPVMVQGEPSASPENLQDIRKYAEEQLDTLDPSYRRIINPHIYKVSISDELMQLKTHMVSEFRKTMNSYGRDSENL